MKILIIIDLKDTIDEFSKETKWYKIYEKFSLNDIISTILNIPVMFMDYKEVLFLESLIRFPNDITTDEICQIEFFYDILIQEIDKIIGKVISPNYTLEEIRFIRWMNNTSILISTDVLNDNG